MYKNISKICIFNASFSILEVIFHLSSAYIASGQGPAGARNARNARARASYTRNSGPLKGALIIYAGLQGPLSNRWSCRTSYIFIGPLGPLAQGVRIPCIVMAFSSGISRHLKVPLKYPVKPGPLRGPYAINLFPLCSLGAVPLGPPLH